MADKSSDHEHLRKILNSPNLSPKIRTNSAGKMDKQKNYESDNDSGLSLYSYLEQLSGKPEEVNVVQMDHTYSLPRHSRPENAYAKPAKLLFVSNSQKVAWDARENVIDPVDVKGTPKPAYDAAKAQALMEETARLVSILRPYPGDPDWETTIDRSTWTVPQNKLFERACKFLHMEQLARLTYKGSWNEPVLRRISLDKVSRRFRSLMYAVSWKEKQILWLHNILLENLDTNYLIIYIDILQTLHKKIPNLLERMLSGPANPKINSDALSIFFKKPWDPAANGLTNYKPKRLPGNPLILIVPYGCNGGSDSSPRMQRWLPYLSNIGTIIPVNTNTSNKITVVTSLEHMMSATRAKLAELRSDYGGKPIILFGLNSGSALACQVALIEQVAAVVCLGFPVNTVEDKRGQPDDNIHNLTTPVLFVIGQHAATSYVDDIEDIREKLKVETGLVVVGSADDQLRIPKSKQRSGGFTQSMLDRCIIDEVADFVGTILSTPKLPPSSLASHTTLENRSRYKVVEKKRKISIQEDAYPRKQYVTTNRRGMSGRGRGRSRYITQTTTGGIAISRRGGITDKGVTRPSIENISVINTSNIDHTALSGETIKILPQIKVLGSDDFTKMETGESFSIDQLTPDRLLEMPVIIAPDSQEEPQESQIKVVMGEDKSGGDGTQKITLNSASGTKGDVKCATIYFRKRGTTYHGTRVSTINVNNRQVRKPHLQHLPISEYHRGK